MKFSGKCIIVTGAGQGIGAAIAMAFAAEGANVVLADINSATTNQVVREIVKNGGKAIFSNTNSGRWDQVQKMVNSTVKSFGGVDVLVNNAAIQLRNSILEIDPKEWDKVIQTNLTGYFYVSKAVGRMMILKRQGKIINISSAVARSSSRVLGAHYAVSKAGILALTRQLAIELAPYVNVNSVLPGTTDTPTFRKFVRKDMIKKISKNTPIGRLGTPDDVARAVLFLASEDSCFMTGTSLDVNGGSVMI